MSETPRTDAFDRAVQDEDIQRISRLSGYERMREHARTLERELNARCGEADQRDAARYRWLREPQEHSCVEFEQENEDGYTNTFYNVIRDELDDAIDAAMSAQSDIEERNPK